MLSPFPKGESATVSGLNIFTQNLKHIFYRYDFYLVPQSVRQGTVSATSFNVIHDDINLSPTQLQTLTYKLSHIYVITFLFVLSISIVMIQFFSVQLQ